MAYQLQTIEDIISSNYDRLITDRILNKALLFIIIETKKHMKQVTKKAILKEFQESKHTINSVLRFMDGLGFIEIEHQGKEKLYTVTETGVAYLDKYLATTQGLIFYSETGYDKKI